MRKSKPILFSTEMVQAILSGGKNQTRREVKSALLRIQHGADWKQKGPFGAVGDYLWVRETHYRLGHWEPVKNSRDELVMTKTGRQKWRFVADTAEVLFEPPSVYSKSRHKKAPEMTRWHKRLARFMPRAASRINLLITAVAVERLQAITGCAVMREGIPSGVVSHFALLWERINGPKSWDKNPWVWVIDFKVVKGAT